MKELTLIGRVERIELPQFGIKNVPAKIDTGADASSIWANASITESGKLEVVFFGVSSPFYDGKVHTFSKNEFTITRVANSFGHREVRYKLKLKIKVNGRLINGSFSLADRQNKLYPMLIGRSLLHKKFLVDVSKGEPLAKEEKARKKRLEKELRSMIDEEIS